MTTNDHERLRCCRIALMADAEQQRSKMSRAAWEERAEESEAGQLVGALEIEAIGALVFGKRRFKAR